MLNSIAEKTPPKPVPQKEIFVPSFNHTGVSSKAPGVDAVFVVKTAPLGGPPEPTPEQYDEKPGFNTKDWAEAPFLINSTFQTFPTGTVKTNS
jgi:hypothetical protein